MRERDRDRERLGAEHDEINYQGDNQDWPEWEAEPESHDQNCEDGEHCSLLRWFIVLLTIALILYGQSTNHCTRAIKFVSPARS